MELAIDSSSNVVGLALSHEGEVAAELCWGTRMNHTVELAPALQALLHQFKVEPHSLKAIFVAIGPGSFNGLRAGLSFAKGLSLSLGLPVVGVSTLAIEAYPFAFTRLPICPIHDAGRGELAMAIYQQQDSWKCLAPEHITSLETLLERTTARTVFCGEIPDLIAARLKEVLGDRAVIPETYVRRRRAGYLSVLGWNRFARQDCDDPATIQPLYLRKPPITQPKPR